MKIGRIEIHHYHQFKDLTLDLTYPKGHPKANQCLDKVCFIGQSGTGKTSLLNMCRAAFAEQFVPSDMSGVTVMSLFPGPHVRKVTIEQGHSDVEYVQHVLARIVESALNPHDFKHDEDFLQEFYQDSMRLISYPAMLAYYSASVLNGEESQSIKNFIGVETLQKGDI